MEPKLITLNVNGRTHQVALKPNVTLLHALRTWGIRTSRMAARKETVAPAPSC